MSDTISIVAHLSEGPVVLGQCTLTQAQQLVRQGVFVWDATGETLNPRDPGVSVAGSMPSEAWVPQESGVYKYNLRNAKLGSSWMKEAENIDPEGILTSVKEAAPTTACSTLDEWLDELMTRKAQGHELLMADEPGSLCLGFVDCVEARHFSIGLAKVKRAKPDLFEKYDLSRDCLSTSESRRGLVEGVQGLFNGDLAIVWAPEELAEIEALREQEIPVLDDLAPAFDAFGAKIS